MVIYKTLILIILFVGLLSISIETVKVWMGSNKPTTKIEYRYIPRTFEEEDSEPVFASEIFDTMFSQPSPWILSVRDYDQRRQESINNYFINQA